MRNTKQINGEIWGDNGSLLSSRVIITCRKRERVVA
jgi:hypothetical protein